MLLYHDEVIEKIESLIGLNGERYRAQAYLFVLSALEYTVKKLDRIKESNDKRHVTGQELSVGIKDYALSEFGPTARLVFAHWGINKTDDFGSIVYDLISVGLLGKNDSDKIEDFHAVFDLDSEMVANYKYKIVRKQG